MQSCLKEFSSASLASRRRNAWMTSVATIGDLLECGMIRVHQCYGAIRLPNLASSNFPDLIPKLLNSGLGGMLKFRTPGTVLRMDALIVCHRHVSLGLILSLTQV